MSGEPQAVEALVTELSTALADLVQAAQESQANTGEIGATLVDLLDVLKAHKPGGSTEDLCKAIRELKPQVTVNVSPTPINNVVNVERGAYKFAFDYDAQDRITGATVTPVKNNG